MGEKNRKLNLPSVQYYHLIGDNDQLITYLNCFQSCIYNVYKTEQKIRDEDLIEIFLGDTAFGVIEAGDGSIYDIVFMDGAINKLGFTFFYTLGQGMEVLPAVEALLEQGKAVIIQTYMQRVPFFINFIGFDYPLDEEHYRQNFRLYHTFLVVGYDREHLYYVESPYVLNKEHYLPYENNQSIGVISKKELIPAFNTFFNYTYLKFDEKQPPDMFDNMKLDIVKSVMAKSFSNYHQKVAENGKKNCFCGKAAMDRLHWHFQNGTMDLQQTIAQFNIKLDQLLIWKFQFIMNRRYILARALEKYRGDFASGDAGALVDLLNSNVKAWRILISKLKRIQARKETSYQGLDEISGKISLLEGQIVDKMGKLAQIN